VQLDAEVRFYTPETASARLPPSTGDPVEQAAEVKLFAHWASQVFADIGPNALGDIFAARLEQVHAWPGEELEQRLDSGTALDGGAVLPLVQFVTEADGKPKRRFHAALLVANGKPNAAFFALARQGDWRLKLHGMHFSGKQGALDFGGSIFVLLHALLLRRRHDADYVEKLSRTARFVAFAYTVGQLRLPIAWTEWAAYAGDYGWSGRVPSMSVALPLGAYRVKTISDEFWLESQVAAGRQLFSDVPENQLPFVSASDQDEEV
jgi:hypothetical protein